MISIKKIFSSANNILHNIIIFLIQWVLFIICWFIPLGVMYVFDIYPPPGPGVMIVGSYMALLCILQVDLIKKSETLYREI